MDKLPDEINLKVLSHLEEPDIWNASLVSHRFRRLSLDDTIFIRICKPYFAKMGYPLAYEPPSKDYFKWYQGLKKAYSSYFRLYRKMDSQELRFQCIFHRQRLIFPVESKELPYLEGNSLNRVFSMILTSMQFFDKVHTLLSTGIRTKPVGPGYDGWGEPLPNTLILDLFCAMSHIGGLMKPQQTEDAMANVVSRVTRAIAPSTHCKVKPITEYFNRMWDDRMPVFDSRTRPLLGDQFEVSPRVAGRQTVWTKCCFYALVCRRLGLDAEPYFDGKGTEKVVVRENNVEYLIAFHHTIGVEKEGKVGTLTPTPNRTAMLGTFDEHLRNCVSLYIGEDGPKHFYRKMMSMRCWDSWKAIGWQSPMVSKEMAVERSIQRIEQVKAAARRNPNHRVGIHEQYDYLQDDEELLEPLDRNIYLIDYVHNADVSLYYILDGMQSMFESRQNK